VELEKEEKKGGRSDSEKQRNFILLTENPGRGGDSNWRYTRKESQIKIRVIHDHKRSILGKVGNRESQAPTTGWNKRRRAEPKLRVKGNRAVPLCVVLAQCGGESATSNQKNGQL